MSLDLAMFFMLACLAFFVGVACLFFAAITIAIIPSIYRLAKKSAEEMLD